MSRAFDRSAEFHTTPLLRGRPMGLRIFPITCFGFDVRGRRDDERRRQSRRGSLERDGTVYVDQAYTSSSRSGCMECIFLWRRGRSGRQREHQRSRGGLWRHAVRRRRFLGYWACGRPIGTIWRWGPKSTTSPSMPAPPMKRRTCPRHSRSGIECALRPRRRPPSGCVKRWNAGSR